MITTHGNVRRAPFLLQCDARGFIPKSKLSGPA